MILASVLQPVKRPVVRPILGNAITKVQRYFRRNKGTDDYATVPVVTLTVNTRIEFYLLTTKAATQYIFDNSEASNRAYAYYDHAASDIKTSISGGSISVDGGGNAITNDGKLHHVVITGSGAGQIIANLLANNTAVFKLEGILADFEVYDDATLIRDYPLDEPKGASVIYDTVGGNNGAIVNGDDDDWGLFDKTATGWSGQEVAPRPLPIYADGTVPQYGIMTNGDGPAVRIGSLYEYSLTVDVATPSIQWLIGNTGVIYSSSGTYSGEKLATDATFNRFRTLEVGAVADVTAASLKEVLKNA